MQNKDGDVFQCFLDELKDDSKPEGIVWTEAATLPYSDPTLGSRSIQAYDIQIRNVGMRLARWLLDAQNHWLLNYLRTSWWLYVGALELAVLPM